MGPRISVIIPARDAGQTLGACLDALAREGVPGPDAELLVVDDASNDDTGAIAGARAGVRVLRSDGSGPAAARNVGAHHASGELLLFLDADTAPCRGWLKEMCAPLADPDIVAVKGAYRTLQSALIARFAQLEFEEKYDRLARARKVDFVDAGTAAYRRSVLLGTGGFDEQYPAQSVEDVELAFRLGEKGAHFAFNPRALVLHRHAESARDYLWKKLRYGYFRLRLYRRYPTKALGDSYTPPLMAVQIALAGTSLLGLLLSLLRLPGAGRFSATVVAVFGATTLPLAQRAGSSGQTGLALAVPLLVFSRSLAQGLGLLAGILHTFLSRPDQAG